MAILPIDLSGRHGLATRHWGDYDRIISVPNLRYIASDTQMVDGIYNPFRRYGYLSPANATFTDVQTGGATPTLNLTSSIYDPVNEDFYFAEAGQKLWRGDTLDDLDLTEVLDLGATGTPEIMDIEFYQINNVRKMFVVYETGGNMDIAVSNIPYSNSTDSVTWLTGSGAAGTATGSANATGGFTNAITNRPFMRVSDNGFAYLFQDSYVHKIDGTTTGGTGGTVSANTLVFPGFFQITDALDYRGFQYICIRQDTLSNITETFNNFKSDVGIYIWNKQSTVFNSSDYIALSGVKYIKKIYVTPEGKIRLNVINIDRICEIREFNGSAFIPIKEIGYLSYPTYHDSVVEHARGIIWVGRDGYIYFHGRITPDENEGLFKIAKFANATDKFTGIGAPSALLYGGAAGFSYTTGYKPTRQALYLSYSSDAAAKRFKTIDLMGTGTKEASSEQAQGDVFTAIKYLPPMSTVNDIDILMAPGEGSGSTIAGTVKIYFNQSTTAWASKTITRDQSATGYFRIPVNKSFINSIQLEIEFSSSTLCGTVDFAPSLALVDYTPTDTRG